LKKETTINAKLLSSVNYILGFNSSSQSYVVGFGSKAPKQPHHRNVYESDANNMSGLSITSKNQQHGYLIGGALDGSMQDDINNYQYTEGGIDYNAGFVGALGWVCSIKDPVDLSKFGQGCNAPKLGADQSLCGVSQIVLNANLPTTNRTFSWKKDGSSVSGSGATLTVTSAGTYTVTADSLGCTTSDQIVVTASIPTVNLGADAMLASSMVLDAGVAGTGLSYQWSKNGTTVSGATSKTLTITSAGTYGVTVSGSGCTSQSDEIIISPQPAFSFTSSTITVDGTKDAAYIDAYAISKNLVGTPSASSLSANWYGLWNNTNVYLFVSITDNALYNDSGSTWYEDDATEICIDGNNSKGTSYDGSNDFQWGFVYNGTTVQLGSNNPSNSGSGVSFKTVKTSAGWDVEILIPWSRIGVTPSVGKLIGFDVCINDDDNGSGREYKKSWNQATDDGWQNPSLFGTVVLAQAADQTPVANAGTDKTIKLPTNSVSMSGTASGGDGNLTYAWSQISGPSTASVSGGTTLTPTYSNLVQGTYVLRLTVTDGDGDTSTDDISVIVNPNLIPVVNAGTDANIQLPTSSVTKTGTASSGDGTLTYAWSQVSGPGTATITNGSTLTATFSNLVAGTYVFRLTATDADGDKATDDVSVEVTVAVSLKT